MNEKDQEQVLFKIDPDPTFWETVEIPMPGGKVGKIKVEFVFKDREQYSAFFKEQTDKKDSEALPLLIRSWSGPDAEYSPETLGRLLRNYPQAGLAITNAYRDSLFGAERKN